jgi:DNA replication protein DnaD
MKSFKEYSKVKNNSTLETEEKTAAEDLTKKIAAAYNGKSNAAMLQNILREAEKNKRAGTLSNEEIDKFYESFSPMLDQAQRKRLRAVVERLKNI